jgi:Ca-activated chloride channel family protein
MNRTCQECQKLLTPHLAGDLTPAGEKRLRKHLEKCPDCQAALAALQPAFEEIRQVLSEPPAETPRLSGDRRTRVLNAARTAATRERTFADSLARWFDFGFPPAARYIFIRAALPALVTILLVIGFGNIMFPHAISIATPGAYTLGGAPPLETDYGAAQPHVYGLAIHDPAPEQLKELSRDLERLEDLPTVVDAVAPPQADLSYRYDRETASEQASLEKKNTADTYSRQRLFGPEVNGRVDSGDVSGDYTVVLEDRAAPASAPAPAQPSRPHGFESKTLSDSDEPVSTVTFEENSPLGVGGSVSKLEDRKWGTGGGGETLGRLGQPAAPTSGGRPATDKDADGPSEDTLGLNFTTKSPIVFKGLWTGRSEGGRSSGEKTKNIEAAAEPPANEVIVEIDKETAAPAESLSTDGLVNELKQSTGSGYYYSGAPSEGLSDHAQTQKTGRQEDALIREGRARLAEGKHQDAADRFKSALALDPENKEAMRYLERAGKQHFASGTIEFKAKAENMITDVRDAWNPQPGKSDPSDKSDRSDLSDKSDESEKLAQSKVQEEARKKLEKAQREEESAKAPEKPAENLFRAFGVNPYVETAKQPFSTFAIDVDTASYTFTRNNLLQGRLPPPESVRTEEIVNFFDYHYSAPPAEALFAVHAQCAPSPFRPGQQLLRIGVKARHLGREENRPAVLTFAVDTSGSMSSPERLGLVQRSLRLLVDKLSPDDLVALVQFDSHARLVLDYTRAADKAKILKAIDALQTSGSTNLEEGMRLAYELARRAFRPGSGNRVLLLSDGAANLGGSTAEEILAVVADSRRQGIFCSVYGVGRGGLNDAMLESLANKGDGSYVYLDSLDEARRVFVDELASSLNTVAADVKIQVEFAPARVSQYRQIGYENRQLKKEDFRNDAIDAGEVGSGQSVTALYDLSLAPGTAGPLGVVRVRYRDLRTGRVGEIAAPLAESMLVPAFDKAEPAFQLAACAAQWAEFLRGSPYTAGDDPADLAAHLRRVALQYALDPRVQELVRLADTTAQLKPSK